MRRDRLRGNPIAPFLARRGVVTSPNRKPEARTGEEQSSRRRYAPDARERWRFARTSHVAAETAVPRGAYATGRAGRICGLFWWSPRAEARTRVRSQCRCRFECGSAVAAIDGGGGRFRNRSLSASLSADAGEAVAIA